MLVLPVDPVLLEAGPYVVRWYGALALLGLVGGVWLAVRAAERGGSRGGVALNAAAAAIPVGVLAARASQVLGSWEFYFQRPAEVWQVPLAGMSLWGGLAGGSAAGAWVLRRDPGARIRLADAAVWGLAAGIALGRLGQLLDGAGQGLPSSLPWATQYTSPASSVPDFGVPRHPAQAYDLLAVLAAAAAARVAGRCAPPGRRFWVFVALYAATRVALGGVRLDPAFVLGLQIDQVIAGGAMLLALGQLARQWRTAGLARGEAVAAAT